MRGYKHMAVSWRYDVTMDPRVKPEDDGGGIGLFTYDIAKYS